MIPLFQLFIKFFSNYKDPFEEHKKQTIAERDANTYRAGRLKQQLSPGNRYDAFDPESKTPDARSTRRTYADVMRETQILNQQARIFKMLFIIY